jgi:predicted ATP-binding protein involved in virulence
VVTKKLEKSDGDCMEEQYFIKEVFIKDVRGIKDFRVPLSEKERKHLIFTGKNGSGKTSVLEEMDGVLGKVLDGGYKQFLSWQKAIENNKRAIENLKRAIAANQKAIENHQKDIEHYKKTIENQQKTIENNQKAIETFQQQIDNFSNVNLLFSWRGEKYEKIRNGHLLLSYFPAQRLNKPKAPTTVTKNQFQKKYPTKPTLNETFIQYIVNLKTSQAFAQIRGDSDKVSKIGNWFTNFENSLKRIFGKEDLKLVFYDKYFNFQIEYEDKSFALNELSDGYSSLLAIVTELILRMEAHGVDGVKAYDMQGVVLVDEIETHLHVELQKEVLPFLIDFFPNIQFIVSTHSPFVLSSCSNAVICDLERREVLSSERFKNASYSEIVKNYFKVDSEFSRVLLEDIEEYERLVELFESGEFNEENEQKLYDLDIKLDKISPMLTDEVYLRFKEAQEKISDD